MTALPGEPWDLGNLASGIVDPADRYRTRDTAPRRLRLPQTAQDARTVDSRAFGRNVIAERARLAILDPAGEWDALTRVSPATALRTLRRLNAATPAPTSAVRTLERRPDGRDLLTRLGADPNRGRGVMRCVAHEDRSPSLSWRLADDGRALLYCHSGCSFGEIVAAVR